jgi:hypothetical protein
VHQDCRGEAGIALTDLMAKGMQVKALSPAQVNRMRDTFTQVNASIASHVGMDLWKDTPAAVAKARGGQEVGHLCVGREALPNR